MPSPFAIATSLPQARQSIEARVREWWVTDLSRPASRIAWANTNFQPPAISDTQPEWLQVSIVWGDTTSATLAHTNALNRRVGILFLTIFGERHKGAGILEGLASSAFAKFNRAIADGIEYYQCSGPSDVNDPTLASAQLAIRFFFWETVTPSITT